MPFFFLFSFFFGNYTTFTRVGMFFWAHYFFGQWNFFVGGNSEATI
jgi:hypothetical protein